MHDDLPLLKNQIRREAAQRCRELPDRASKSAQILSRLATLPEFQSARSMLLFLGVRAEVQTAALLTGDLLKSKAVSVPWCDGPRLRLFQMTAQEELSPGAFGIPEPLPEWRNQSDRERFVQELDLILVPGVAFDRRGGRIGHGKGYYDRLLSEVEPHTALVSLAFECQLVPECPMEAHDRRVQIIVTENEIIRHTND